MAAPPAERLDRRGPTRRRARHQIGRPTKLFRRNLRRYLRACAGSSRFLLGTCSLLSAVPALERRYQCRYAAQHRRYPGKHLRTCSLRNNQ
jgi:hypothetical protein